MTDAVKLLPPCRIAIPKKGRLYEKCCQMLSGAGIDYHREDRLDVAICPSLNLTLCFLPASDIAVYVAEGDVDLGVTGLDIINESGVTVKVELELGFGKCKLCVQAPISKGYKSAEDLSGCRVVTSFPEITRKFFRTLDAWKPEDQRTKVRYVSGSVEAACGLGLADAVVDLVETGTTMKAAGLEIIKEILVSEALLISNPKSEYQDIIKTIKDRVEGYITATKYMMISYNIPRTLLALGIAITPGKKSPTITGLVDSDEVSVSSLVNKKEAGLKMDELAKVGATDILLFAIANSRM